MIKAENIELYNNTARALREDAMLLLLRRTLTDAVTFCAFENIRCTDDNLPESSGTAICVRKLVCKFKKKMYYCLNVLPVKNSQLISRICKD